MFPTYGQGIQQGYWNGNQFIAPQAQAAQIQNAPAAIPVTQGLLPQAQPLAQPQRQGLLDGGNGPGDNGPSENAGSMGIGDVNGGVIGNLGTIGTIAGIVAGVPGLGTIGSLAQTAAETMGYENDLSAMNYNNNFARALAHNMSSGVFGTSTHDQARDAVRGYSRNNNNPGDTNAFGGRVVGKMTNQARTQGRGGSAPEGQNSGSANSGAPGMGGVADPSAPGAVGATPGGIGEGDGDGSKIICTQMNKTYGFGSFRNAVWMRHAVGLPPQYQRGYHRIFRPILNWAYNGNQHIGKRLTRSILEWGVRHRTADLWRQRRGKRDWIGAGVRLIFDNICYLVGRIL
jgi:hypothetical protein